MSPEYIPICIQGLVRGLLAQGNDQEKEAMGKWKSQIIQHLCFPLPQADITWHRVRTEGIITPH